ncbi:MAG: hypothetical protein ACRDBX_01575 [Erysipelotrichaceae bacterium]
MRNISSIIVSFLGLMLFIWLFPALLWLAMIIVALILIGLAYLFFKVRRSQKEMQRQFEDMANEYTSYDAGSSYFYRESSGETNPDVIDVEYSVHDEEE